MTQTQTKPTNNNQEINVTAATQTSQDLRNAVLIVSVVVNLFIFIAWLAMQVTTQYDAQIAGFLFNR